MAVHSQEFHHTPLRMTPQRKRAAPEAVEAARQRVLAMAAASPAAAPPLPAAAPAAGAATAIPLPILQHLLSLAQHMPRQHGQVAGQVPGLPGAVVVGAGQRPAAALPPLSGAAALAALQQLQQLQAAAAMAAALGQQQALAAAQAQQQAQVQPQPAANGVAATAQQVRRHMSGCDQACPVTRLGPYYFR